MEQAILGVSLTDEWRGWDRGFVVHGRRFQPRQLNVYIVEIYVQHWTSCDWYDDADKLTK